MLTAKKIKIVLLVSLFFFIAMPIIIGAHATPASAKPIELTLAFRQHTLHTLHLGLVKYAKEVEQLTDGQVKITIYAGGALGGPLEQWDMAVGGIADISFFMPGYTAGRFPRSTVFDLPLLGGGTTMVNTAIAQGVYDKHSLGNAREGSRLLRHRLGQDARQVRTKRPAVEDGVEADSFGRALIFSDSENVATQRHQWLLRL